MSEKITIELTPAELKHIAVRLQSPLESEGYGDDGGNGTKESIARTVSAWIASRAQFVENHHWNESPTVSRETIISLGKEFDRDASILALIAAKLPG